MYQVLFTEVLSYILTEVVFINDVNLNPAVWNRISETQVIYIQFLGFLLCRDKERRNNNGMPTDSIT